MVTRNKITRADDAAHIPADSNVSNEHLALLVKLLADMTKADGKVLNVENTAAETVLESHRPNYNELVKRLYQATVQTHPKNCRSKAVNRLIADLDIDQKLDVLRAMWIVANSDGEIHPDEQVMILDVMKAMSPGIRT